MDSNFNLWQSLALAAVQGATEFLPVSSSGHLVLVRRLFGWSDQSGLVFDTVLHGGSLAAILIYFWREWVAIFRAYFAKNSNSVCCQIPQSVFAKAMSDKSKIGNLPPEADPWPSSPARNATHSVAGGLDGARAQAGRPPMAEKSKIESAVGAYYRRLPWLVAIATLPVVIAGPVLKPLLESCEQIRNVPVTGLSMIMTALLFLLAECRRPAAEKRISFPNALFIGCMQIIALLPGASRSGWTTAGGVFCGQKRESAVRFAFFMAVPAITGAIIFQSREIIRSLETAFDPLFILSGFIVSLIVSLGAIHFCLKYFRSHSLRPFAVYLMIIGLLSFLVI
ncbi:MAG: undecaprenyl-diphosphate phosphatase [Kiritimatiellia bacterium]|nr:undecaprenyl-diphosphate phosphatase [Kiritimatiellia bacterium]